MWVPNKLIELLIRHKDCGKINFPAGPRILFNPNITLKDLYVYGVTCTYIEDNKLDNSNIKDLEKIYKKYKDYDKLTLTKLHELSMKSDRNSADRFSTFGIVRCNNIDNIKKIIEKRRIRSGGLIERDNKIIKTIINKKLYTYLDTLQSGKVYIEPQEFFINNILYKRPYFNTHLRYGDICNIKNSLHPVNLSRNILFTPSDIYENPQINWNYEYIINNWYKKSIYYYLYCVKKIQKNYHKYKWKKIEKILNRYIINDLTNIIYSYSYKI